MNNNGNNPEENNYLSGNSLAKYLFKDGVKHLVCMVSNLNEEDALQFQNLNLIVGYEELEDSFIFISNDGNKWNCAIPVSSKNNQPLYIKTEG